MFTQYHMQYHTSLMQLHPPGHAKMMSRLPSLIRSPTPSLHHHLRRRRRRSSAVAASSPPKPHQTPLFLRPLAHSATTADVRAFRRWAESLASSAGASIAASEGGGPDAAHLTRELAWLLEDAVAEDGEIFRLRLGLDEMYGLWKERIEERRPFQYVVGCEHWRDLVLAVREGVLIPRPETEMVVDMVSEVEGFEEGVWADLGTGSGALAVGIGRMLGGGGRVVATDVSRDAVDVARFNVERYGLQALCSGMAAPLRPGHPGGTETASLVAEDKVEIREGSWLEPLQDVKGKLAGLVSNPPYIPSSHIAGLQAEVGKHEPRLALDGGENGVDHLLHLCEESASALKPGGFFAFETNGDEQSEFIAEFINTKWGEIFHNVKIVLDLAGIKRFVTGFRQ